MIPMRISLAVDKKNCAKKTINMPNGKVILDSKSCRGFQIL